MAGSIYVPLKTVFDDSGLRKAQKSISSVGKNIKGVLGALGVGVGIGAIASQLDAAGRAAAQDAKSQAVLANSLRNVAGATEGAIAQSEAFISKLQMQVGIADDQLRPVFSRLVAVTGDLTKSQELLAVATDLAAAKNIDVTAAGNALAKAVGGQTTALFRLAPELKKSSDWMALLKANTAGAAEVAANSDPYQRLTVIFGEMQEQIGYALLPAMQKIADFIASDAFQGAFGSIVNTFADFVTAIQISAEAIDNAISSMNFSFERLNASPIYKTMDFLIKKIFPVLSLLESFQKLGADANAKSGGTDETSRLIRRRLESLGAIGVPDVSTTTKQTGSTKKLATENKALTDAVNAAKAAFEAKVKAYQDAVNAAQQIIDATKEMTASFTALFKVTPKMGEFESKTVDAFQNIFDTIKSSLADKRILQSAADALTAYTNSTLNSLKAIAKQQDVLAGKIDVARTITAGVTGLANITSMLETTTESVTTSVRTIAGGIESIITKTADVTKTGGLVDNFQKLVDKTKSFAKNLIDLKKMGLNKNLFAQLVNAGADAGGATAQAIVDGGSETIMALNDLYGQLDTAAADIAKTSTDTLYEVGQQVVTNGFIEGLVSQADALAAAAEAMAKTFADAFNAKLQSALQIALPAAPVASGNDLTTNLANRPSPTASPQRYAAWLAGIGGIDPIRSPQSYAAAQKNYNITLNTGIVTSPAGLGAEVVSAISAYERASGTVYVKAI